MISNITTGYFVALLLIFAISGTLLCLTSRGSFGKTLFIHAGSTALLFVTVLLSAVDSPSFKLWFGILVVYVLLSLPFLPKLSLRYLRLSPAEASGMEVSENEAPFPGPTAMPSTTPSKFIAILLFGEFTCYDFLKKHKDEAHTSVEWLNLANEYYDDDWGGISARCFEFETSEERSAFVAGVEAVDSCESDDHYHACVLVDGILDSL